MIFVAITGFIYSIDLNLTVLALQAAQETLFASGEVMRTTVITCATIWTVETTERTSGRPDLFASVKPPGKDMYKFLLMMWGYCL